MVSEKKKSLGGVHHEMYILMSHPGASYALRSLRTIHNLLKLRTPQRFYDSLRLGETKRIDPISADLIRICKDYINFLEHH